MSERVVMLGPCDSCADDAGQPPAVELCDQECPRPGDEDQEEGAGCGRAFCAECWTDHLAVYADPEHVPGMVLVDALDTCTLAGRVLAMLQDEYGLAVQGAEWTSAQLAVQALLDGALQDELDLAEECPC